jgi:hypothetical protein
MDASGTYTLPTYNPLASRPVGPAHLLPPSYKPPTAASIQKEELEDLRHDVFTLQEELTELRQRLAEKIGLRHDVLTLQEDFRRLVAAEDPRIPDIQERLSALEEPFAGRRRSVAPDRYSPQ